ncbi:MAG TPA: SpoIIE family protein phosphatase [Streptosporangiaceae bacterium]|nr:SpoIIE family protein phosphatase [Streptosporangiaceae bacterium]
MRQAAGLPGAELGPLLEAALAELDGAVQAIAGAEDPASGGPGGDLADGPHAERRLLQAVYQQVPVPLFLLGLDGTVRRANSAAGQLVGSRSGYPTGKLLTAFIDLPFRAALQSQLAAVVRTGETRTLRCGVLTAGGVTECEVTVCPVLARGDSGQLIAAMTAPGGALPGPAAEFASGMNGDPEDPALRSATRRLDLVTAATRILLENTDNTESVTMQRFARLLARELSAWLILDVDRNDRLRRQLVVSPEDQPSEELARQVAGVDPAPGSVPAQVHQTGISMLVAHAEDPDILGTGPGGPGGVPLLMQLGATSLVCVPVAYGDHPYGVLTLARGARHGPFGMADVGLVEELGEQLALAIRSDRVLRHRTEIADALQASLLPRQPRQFTGAEVAAGHLAAIAQYVGSDFYDSYPAGNGWGISIGDVCGGQDLAAVTAAARHAIRVLAHQNPDPAVVLRGANEIMMAEEFGGRFVTASVCCLQWQDGSLHVVLGSAGHPWPVLVRPDGRTQVLQGGGLPLGIFPDAEPATQELELEPGDLLFLFTDGLISACGPHMVDFEDRLTDELAALAGEPAARVVSRMEEVVLEICGGELRDNVTMLALRAGEAPDG